MDTARMGTLEAILFILVVITNKIILNTPRAIILSCGSSSVINTIYISILAMILVIIIVKLFKRFESYDIFDISSYLGGTPLKIFMGIGYMVGFLVMGALVLRDFGESLRIIYYTNSPLLYIMLFFILGAIISNRFGAKAIIKSNALIMPIAVFSILIILFSSFKNFTFERIFPILGNGIDATFLSGASNIFSLTGITYLFLIMPYLKDSKKFKKISYISIGISTIYLTVSVLCLLLVFPYVTTPDGPTSIYLFTRTIEFGDFLQRIDAVFVLLFILSTLSYLSITLFMTLSVFKKVTNIEDSKAMTYCFATLIFGLALIPKNVFEVKIVNTTFFRYFVIFFAFLFSTIVLFFANLKKKKEEKND